MAPLPKLVPTAQNSPLRFAVIGAPVAHSLSPQMHAAAFLSRRVNATFERCEVAPSELAATLTELRQTMRGLSVTVPHKEAIMPLCDEVSMMAKRVGAVNCVSITEAGLVGHNTDAPGFVTALLADGVGVENKNVVLLGAGGAARAVELGLSQAGANVEVVARQPANVTWVDAHKWAILDDLLPWADVVVDCTPTGLRAGDDQVFAAIVPLSKLKASAVVVSLVYHRTPALLVQASARGHRTIDGVGMLAYQGALAWPLWGLPHPDVREMLAAVRTSIDN
ncbi:MAG: shikimate dehydrogenase [Myxococcales bacterium]|nr:shikimate dehydrogenase [Myxococcales bacterium]